MQEKLGFRTIYILLVILCTACSSDENTESITENEVTSNTSLASLIEENTIEIDNVIACAASSEADPNTIIAFVYPREGATDIRFYETENAEVDKNEYTNYLQIPLQEEDFFNGYLKMFKRTVSKEKWVIITFFEDNKLHLSNPIRLKQLDIPTEYTSEVTINTRDVGMPLFIWKDGAIAENAIYFQVISDEANELLSGTYTFEKQFQYYLLDNVVLNITRQEPPILEPDSSYNFTLMGVSEDNWVNLFIQRNFTN